MFSQFLHRYAAAGLYLASFVAALLSAASLVAIAQEPDVDPYSTPLAFEAPSVAR